MPSIHELGNVDQEEPRSSSDQAQQERQRSCGSDALARAQARKRTHENHRHACQGRPAQNNELRKKANNRQHANAPKQAGGRLRGPSEQENCHLPRHQQRRNDDGRRLERGADCPQDPCMASNSRHRKWEVCPVSGCSRPQWQGTRNGKRPKSRTRRWLAAARVPRPSSQPMASARSSCSFPLRKDRTAPPPFGIARFHRKRQSEAATHAACLTTQPCSGTPRSRASHRMLPSRQPRGRLGLQPQPRWRCHFAKPRPGGFGR